MREKCHWAVAGVAHDSAGSVGHPILFLFGVEPGMELGGAAGGCTVRCRDLYARDIIESGRAFWDSQNAEGTIKNS